MHVQNSQLENIISVADILDFFKKIWKSLVVFSLVGVFSSVILWFFFGNASATGSIQLKMSTASVAEKNYILSFQKYLPTLIAETVRNKNAPSGFKDLYSDMSRATWWGKNTSIIDLPKNIYDSSGTLTISVTSTGSNQIEAEKNLNEIYRIFQLGGKYFGLTSIANNIPRDNRELLTAKILDAKYNISTVESEIETLKILHSRFFIPYVVNSKEISIAINSNNENYLPIQMKLNSKISILNDYFIRLNDLKNQYQLIDVNQILLGYFSTLNYADNFSQIISKIDGMKNEVDKNTWRYLNQIKYSMLMTQNFYDESAIISVAISQSKAMSLLRFLIGGAAIGFIFSLALSFVKVLNKA